MIVGVLFIVADVTAMSDYFVRRLTELLDSRRLTAEVIIVVFRNKDLFSELKKITDDTVCSVMSHDRCGNRLCSPFPGDTTV